GRRRGIDVHEVVGGDVDALPGEEEERTVLVDGAAEGGAPLVLAERRLVAIDGRAEDVELLEVVPGVEALVAIVEERVAVEVVGAALGHDVDDAARGLAELR